jgi:hypothetical protein
MAAIEKAFSHKTRHDLDLKPKTQLQAAVSFACQPPQMKATRTTESGMGFAVAMHA